MSTYKIRASFKVYGSFTVEADGFNDALDQLSDMEVFTSYLDSTETYGFDTVALSKKGITVSETDYDAEPYPTGARRTTRQWVYSSTKEEE